MNLRSYALVTAAYWAFTITDGALRMIVLLHFHDLGYSPVTLAFLFLFFVFCGIVTNAVGGWLGTRHGLRITLYAGLALQVLALTALSFQDASWPEAASVAFVMGLQALSGIAKDLTKMSSKSAVKLVVGEDDPHTRSRLFTWVAVLTGSKNALKGVGFFVGGALLEWVGFASALRWMALALGLVLVSVVLSIDAELGTVKKATPFRSILSASAAINRLAAARLFLFGARDIWFVVALPVYLDEVLGWSFGGIGGFLAAWVIGYGIVQSAAPRVVERRPNADVPGEAKRWALLLAGVTAVIATSATIDAEASVVVILGLIVFGAVFAVNSSLHSYLILAYSSDDVALDVGFYYSANAAGRLIGTLLSGLLYLAGGLSLSLWGSTAFLGITWLLSLQLPPVVNSHSEMMVEK